MLIAFSAVAEEVSVFPFAGSNGGRGTRDGVGAAARFRTPRGIARMANGDLIVADAGANTIRRVTSNGRVTTIAGTPGTAGWADGKPGTFNFPEGVAAGADGSVFVTEQLNGSVRLIAPDGSVNTLARGLDRPTGVAVDAERRVYVAETGKNRIVRIANGAVSTFAEVTSPFGVALADDGSLYVATLAGSIVHVSPAGVATAVANNLGGLTGIALAGDGFYVSDRASHRVLRVWSNGYTYPVASWREGLYEPVGLAVGSRGELSIADSYGGAIRQIGGGELTTLAGSPAQWGAVDGTGTNARFTTPMAVAADRDGALYVADYGNNSIRRITRAGEVSTMTAAGLLEPSGVAVDASGRVFVSDRNGVHRIDSGALTTLLQLERPGGLAVDANGTVYVADPRNKAVKKIASGVVSTFAADLSQPGDIEIDGAGNVWIADGRNVLRVTADGHRTSVSSGLRAAGSLAFDVRGHLWVADAEGHTLRRMNVNGTVSATAGRELVAGGSENGVGRNAGFDAPASIATDSFGNVYVVEPASHAVRVAGVYGDANGDFAFDNNDVQLLTTHLRDRSVPLSRFADMNQDGALDPADLSEMKRVIGGRQRPAGR